MTRHIVRNIVFSVVLLSAFCLSAEGKTLDISGRWGISYTPDEVTDTVTLPGTLDTNGIGISNINTMETTQLSRKVTYSGPAYYSRSVAIPKDWKGRDITLKLERTRPTTLWIDGNEVGSVDYLSTPHIYDVSKYLTPGSHEIKVLVDNGDRMPNEIKGSSHAATESTQTNWNGILGDMTIEARSPLHIQDVQAYPRVANRSLRVRISLSQDHKINGKKLKIAVGNGKETVIKLRNGQRDYDAVINLGDTARTWSEHDPYRHTLTAMIEGIDTVTEKVGIREFSTDGHHFLINGTLTFLRGTHDGCVFPLTGYAPMDTESWREYFRTIKDYGLNHVRFHSWCPPEAAFEAADIEGIYLQPELPIWGTFDGKNTTLMDFLMADGEKIHELYSRHPSFVMFSLGNELFGEIPIMQWFVDKYRENEPRHLFTYGTSAFCGWNGHIPGQDFMVTCRVGGGDGYSTHTRASFGFVDAEEGGIMNNTYPDTKRNFENAVLLSPVPVVGHETGQYQVYPDYNEIAKYNGVLLPNNLKVFRQRLADANMLGQADDFFRASGKWSAELYKADMEMNLRTPSMAGFQLLDIKDYPGQGTALVGMLDSFMDSKGLVTPEKWRESCYEIVALAEFPSYTWVGGDTFKTGISLANYSGRDLKDDPIVVRLVMEGKVVVDKTLSIPSGQGYLKVDSLSLTLPDIEKATTGILELSMPSKQVTNSYPLWFYPSDRSFKPETEVLVSKKFDNDEIRHLKNGGTLLLAPSREMVDSITVGGLFTTDYWNYRMFRTLCENTGKPISPGTLGILTNPEHKALAEFPTDTHTNWQWYSVVKNSYPLVLDALNDIDYRPIVQVIDNVERNHRLGLVMEFNVDNGRVLLVMADMDEAIKDPAGEQFFKSLIDYAGSKDFKPNVKFTFEQFSDMLSNSIEEKTITKLRNISYE